MSFPAIWYFFFIFLSLCFMKHFKWSWNSCPNGNSSSPPISVYSKKETHLNVRTWFDPCDPWQNGIRPLNPEVNDFWIQPSDLSIQADFLEINISEGESDVRKTWIPQGGWLLTNLHSMRPFSARVKQDKIDDLLSCRQLFKHTPSKIKLFCVCHKQNNCANT